MKRLIVFLLLLALPIRTVLAVSGFGCTMMPMQMSQAGDDGVPCPMHTADGASMLEAPADSAPSCSSCAAACCAALAPMPPTITGISLVGDYASAPVKTSFANAVPHTLERPPRSI
jgi:hypothetical protein